MNALILFVLSVSAIVICIAIELRETIKEGRYLQEQKTLLPLLLPFMTDTNLWTMHESGRFLEWRSGHFSLTVHPSDFNRSYRVSLWLDNRKGGEKKMMELVFEENGCTRKDRLHLFVTKDMLNNLSQMPFHQTIESVLSDVSCINRS